MADIKWSQLPSQTPVNADEVVGLHSGDNARFSIANIVAAVRNGLASIFVPLTRTINGKGLSTDISLDASDVGAVDTADVGVADGVASLDSTGKVPPAQLPPIASTAADVTYDNTQSGLAADDVQEAIDELAQGGGGGTTVVANPSGAATDVLNKLQVDSTIYQLLSGGTAITFPGFSTTERVVGTWDGYPLYAKIVHQTLQKVSSAQRVTVSSENIVIHLMLGTSQTQNEYSRVPLPYNGYLWAYQDGYTQIVVSLPNSSYNTIDFLLVYTKPSDSPAPTPGGIPGDSVSYDPATSGLTATDAQAALDELAEGKAAKADLTSIQATGTTNTTGAAIPAGAYFYLNGILYQAKTQIDQNATFTVNTNCEQVPNGGFNALETAIAGKGNTKYTGYYAATARTINHSVNVDKNFLILTTGVSTSGDRAMGIFMGFVSATNAAASRVFKVFEPSTGQYPCTISVSTAGQISVTTTVAYVRVTILEFERTVF